MKVQPRKHPLPRKQLGEDTRRVGQTTGLHNNGLHQTGRGGAAAALRRRPVIEARPAADPGCSRGLNVARERETWLPVTGSHAI